MHFSYEDDSDDSASEVRKRRRESGGDKDKDPSKSKKKHKKHKKNKKSSKYENDSKERSGSSKKHKKHRKRHKSNDESNSDTELPAKHAIVQNAKTEREVIVKPLPVVRSSELDVTVKTIAATTLNTKFTQIMKSNGHVVVPKTLTTTKNGNDASAKHSSSSSNISTARIPTDPSKLVELITQSLDSTVPSMQIVSSESESDSVQDVDSPDVAVIEDDELNLEELMKQKALLQARLGNYAMSDTEGEVTPAVKPVAVAEPPKVLINRVNGNFE